MSFLESPGLTATPTSSNQQTISDWAAPYAQNLLSQTQGLANAPMPAYTGQLTAGPSALQNQAWQGLSGLTLPSSFGTAQENLGNISNKAQNLSYTPYDISTDTFNNSQAQAYMNPYLQQSLAPQLQEARRQAQISSTGIAGQATGKGAFGGNREALMQSENLRNLGTTQSNIVGQGYNTAYTNAMAQFNADQARQLQAQQAMAQQNEFGSTLGLQGLQAATSANQALSQSGMNQGQLNLQNLQAQATGGAQQQQLEQNALNAKYNQYLQQLQYPQTMLAMQSSILKGLPMSTTNTYGAMPSGFQQAAGVGAGLASLYGNVAKLPGVASGLESLWGKASGLWDQAGATSTYNDMMSNGGFGTGSEAGISDLSGNVIEANQDLGQFF
jgi:hypothetical protein